MIYNLSKQKNLLDLDLDYISAADSGFPRRGGRGGGAKLNGVGCQSIFLAKFQQKMDQNWKKLEPNEGSASKILLDLRRSVTDLYLFDYSTFWKLIEKNKKLLDSIFFLKYTKENNPFREFTVGHQTWTRLFSLFSLRFIATRRFLFHVVY